MKHYALIGEKLGHSMSVPIHEAIFRKLGIDADYRLVEISREHFARDVRHLMAEVDGFNVTIPYKQDVMLLLDAIDPAAREIGAVNTVVTGEKNLGYNTDTFGIAAMLRHYGMDPAGKPCYVLGSGGTSHTTCATLRRMGAASVTVVSRSPGEGQISYEQLAEEFTGILINTTPAGMWPKVQGCPIDPAVLPSMLRRAQGVADVIYNPPETVLTAAARAAGIPACTGMYMLIDQAVEAERLWQGYDMPQGLTGELMKELKLL